MNPAQTQHKSEPGEPQQSDLAPPALLAQPHAEAIKAVAAIVAPLVLALAVLGGVGSFATVRTMAEPWFGDLAWIVPVGMDVGILILLTWDLLMEYVGLPWPVLRWVAWAYISGTVVVNLVAAHGDLAGSVMHAAMPILFITVVEGVRHLIRQWVGLATGRHMEKIPKPRWLLAPISTALLWRRMVLWHITTYDSALDLEHRHLLAVSRLQREHGRLAWRWRAPLDERAALRRLPADFAHLGSAAPVSDEDWRQSARSTSSVASALPSWLDEKLLDAAKQILSEEELDGVRLNRTAFGRRLRELGFSIANDRLTELRAAATQPSPEWES
ncbi:DUF2637 domain-containing protein [Spirillospora sp. CA-294931]|uniref:DUF2637 domain-containing protein n=1 Tax=Spirillospora sp. CA-294931 TaxID=3240042 RepID=UPI003D8A1C09